MSIIYHYCGKFGYGAVFSGAAVVEDSMEIVDCKSYDEFVEMIRREVDGVKDDILITSLTRITR